MSESIESLLGESDLSIEAGNSTASELVAESSGIRIQKSSLKFIEIPDLLSLLRKSLEIHWKQTHDLTEQAEHLSRWGYKKLAAVIKEDAEQEHQHAQVNIRRLEFFDIPTTIPPLSTETWPRHDMVGLINYNLASVRAASVVEKETIRFARSLGDEITANVMIPLLQGSEDGILLYESYLKLISQMGLDNFLTLQV